MTKTIGVTGGIGAGKSIICELLATIGYPVFYSDKVAKDIMVNSAEIRAQLIALFGQETYKDQQLNRKHLSSIVFENKKKLKQLNAIVHPAVRKAFAHFALESKSPLVFNEAAILFETGADKKFDHILLITADLETRINRVMDRDSASKDEILARINNQWTDERKKELTPFVIENNTESILTTQVLKILDQLTSS